MLPSAARARGRRCGTCAPRPAPNGSGTKRSRGQLRRGRDSRARRPRRRCRARRRRRSGTELPRRIEHVDLRVLRSAGRSRCASRRVDLRAGRPDRGLGRAIEIPQLGAALEQRARQLGAERLTGGDHAEAAVALPIGFDQHAPGCRRRLQDAEASALEQRAQAPRVERCLAIGDHRGRARAQRQEQLDAGDVERGGGDRQPAIGLGDARGVRDRTHQVRERAARDLDAFRPSGRARREQDVRELIRIARER